VAGKRGTGLAMWEGSLRRPHPGRRPPSAIPPVLNLFGLSFPSASPLGRDEAHLLA